MISEIAVAVRKQVLPQGANELIRVTEISPENLTEKFLEAQLFDVLICQPEFSDEKFPALLESYLQKHPHVGVVIFTEQIENLDLPLSLNPIYRRSLIVPSMSTI